MTPRIQVVAPTPLEDEDLRLEDVQWDHLLLSVPKLNVRDRRAFEAVLYVQRTGTPWLDLPEQFGVSGRTAWNRHRAWCRAELWDPLLEALLQTLPTLERELWEGELARAQRARQCGHGRSKRLDHLGDVVLGGL